VRTETLVAVDFGPSGGRVPDVDRLASGIGGAAVSFTTASQPHWRTGEPQIVHRVVFDADRLRNTEAHGIGYRCGFVVHIEAAS